MTGTVPGERSPAGGVGNEDPGPGPAGHPVTPSSRHPVKPVVGLIGGMGSGKSRVAAEFARRGARVISGDRFGHEALRRPEVRDQVVRRWGPRVLDGQGEIDRSRLGAIVFADPAELRALEALSFPWIGRRIEEEIESARGDPDVKLIVLDAAVMLEAGWDRACDRLVYVHAPRDARLRRLAEQRGWGEKEVEARENAQRPLTEKASRADEAVDNSGTPEQLAAQVAGLLGRWGVEEGSEPSPPATSAHRHRP